MLAMAASFQNGHEVDEAERGQKQPGDQSLMREVAPSHLMVSRNFPQMEHAHNLSPLASRTKLNRRVARHLGQ